MILEKKEEKDCELFEAKEEVFNFHAKETLIFDECITNKKEGLYSEELIPRNDNERGAI